MRWLVNWSILAPGCKWLRLRLWPFSVPPIPRAALLWFVSFSPFFLWLGVLFKVSEQNSCMGVWVICGEGGLKWERAFVLLFRLFGMIAPVQCFLFIIFFLLSIWSDKGSVRVKEPNFSLTIRILLPLGERSVWFFPFSDAYLIPPFLYIALLPFGEGAFDWRVFGYSGMFGLNSYGLFCTYGRWVLSVRSFRSLLCSLLNECESDEILGRIGVLIRYA